MANFNVGDIIKANKESNKKYFITNKKRGWTGKVLEIKEAYIRVATLTPVEYKGETYTVEEAYFDLIKDGQIIMRIVNKNAVIVKLGDGRKGVAKCSQADKFNLAFGTALAVARAYGDKETEAKLLAEPSEPVKEKPTFKVGELVRIRQWDDMVKEFGMNECGSIDCNYHFPDGMKPLCGEYAKIVGLAKNGVEVTLKLFGCDKSVQSWHYSTDMIEKV